MTKKTILIVMCTLAILNCSRKKDKPAPLVLDLGKPGTTEVQSELHPNDDVVVLDKNESLEFVTEDGEALVKQKNPGSLKPGDVIVTNEDQRYVVKVKEVKEVTGNGTRVVVRQSNIEDLLNDEQSTLKIEATPKYDLKEIESYVQKAADKNQMITVPPTVDENGKIVVRNLELFNIQVNEGGRISKDQSKIFGRQVSWRNKPINFSFTAEGSYEAKINEMTVEVIPTVRNEMEWNRRKLQKMECRLDARVKYRIDISYKVAGMGRMEAMIDLLPVKSIPLRVPGTPPVWLDIELGMPIGVAIEGNAKGESRVIYEAEYDFYSMTGYNRGDGIHTDSKQNTKVNEKSIQTHQSGFELKGELFLKPNVMIRAYRIAGPYMYLQPYVRGELEIPRRQKKDDLFVGVKGGVGIEFSEPVFTTAIMSYDSGEIFDFGTSFDLDGFEGAPMQALSGIEKNDIVVDRIGNEGFVVINAKTLSKDAFARFELIEGTKNGIIVPAEDFYMSGELHYYPLPESKEETVVLRVTTSDGQKTDVPVKLTVADSVHQEVSKERFGKTTNSYKVATEAPERHSQNVPHYSTGIGIGEYQIDPRSQKQAQLRSMFEEMRMMIPEERYRACRSENRIDINGEAREGTTERFIKCIGVSERTLRQVAQHYRAIAYDTVEVQDKKSAQVSMAAIFDDGSTARFVDLAYSQCFLEAATVSVKDFRFLVQPQSQRCLEGLRQISRQTEGDLLADGKTDVDVRYYLGYSGQSTSIGLGHYQVHIGLTPKNKRPGTETNVPSIYNPYQTNAPSTFNPYYGNWESIHREYDLTIESITGADEKKVKARESEDYRG